MNGIIEFISENWLGISNFLIIIVGLSAFWIYKAQEKSKIQDAASLIVLQIDDLQIRMQEIQSYITEQGLNFSAFYESLLLIDTNYWSKYKHLFVRKMDNKSYNNLNKFYQYILCIQEQQDLLRNLQKNYFFVKQIVIIVFFVSYTTIIIPLYFCFINNITKKINLNLKFLFYI